MADERGAWQVHGERTIYDNRYVRLGLVDVEPPDGRRFEHHVVHLDRVAVALIVNERDEVLMLWRYRFATDEWGYELLGGIVDGDEESTATALRETSEESGWEPLGEPEHLVSFEPIPGMVTAQFDVYLWRGAKRVGDPTDEEEAGIVEWVPLDRVIELTQQRKLLGSGTLVALLYYLASRGAAGQDQAAESS
ncbi:NUDIX hydrolase [Saccharopolyspora sp. HNM0986]|uniref:NUDIX hydrolase n=1 Tax=Saccharopolyspora galaxeae TaxID=2781241 RepID=UPI00190AC665|nr:NUDIX hydrolase [Saccharopolyspora sp. HNM0986]MBK0868302.1 NUDIX hydrolase [Saccharopolyspora sp. HNM0986]